MIFGYHTPGPESAKKKAVYTLLVLHFCIFCIFFAIFNYFCKVLIFRLPVPSLKYTYCPSFFYESIKRFTKNTLIKNLPVQTQWQSYQKRCNERDKFSASQYCCCLTGRCQKSNHNFCHCISHNNIVTNHCCGKIIQFNSASFLRFTFLLTNKRIDELNQRYQKVS